MQQEHTNRILECEEREKAAIVEKERTIKQAQEEFENKVQVRKALQMIVLSFANYNTALFVKKYFRHQILRWQSLTYTLYVLTL